MTSYSHSSKRGAEDYVPTYQTADNGHDGLDSSGRQSKKPRFDVRNPSTLAPDALEDDATLDADIIGNRGQQVRRGAVNIDGYDSDSDNENFDVRAEARAKEKEKSDKKSQQQEDEVDMFADLEEDFKDGDDSDPGGGRRGKGKKAIRFLDEDEIEGQVVNSRSGGHVSADFSLNGKGKGKGKSETLDQSDSDSEVDDAIRASHGELDAEIGAGGKKNHAPKLDAFNMRTENEEGRFDEEGNYVRKALDPDAVHDSWMEGISKKDMRKAKEAHEKREEERRSKAIVDDAKSVGDILKSLIPHLEAGETVLEALARLNKSKQKKPKWQNKRRKTDDEESELQYSKNETAEVVRKQAIDSITEAADLLLARGQLEVYDTERERFTRQYHKETGEEWSDRVETIAQTTSLPDTAGSWHYRWSDARDGGEIHGPFDGVTMKQWNEAGYFGEGVEFRQQGNEVWTRVAEFV